MLSFNEPLVQTFAVHSSILALKTLGMAFLTGRQRFSKKVFANPEDTKLRLEAKVKYDDPDVERVRRAHLNDLENIPVFWVVGALYLTTEPDAELATWLIRAFTVSRCLHTFVYAIKPLPQPSRALAFGVANIVTIYMGVKVIMYYFNAL